MRTKANKEFDCVEFKRQAQVRVYGAIKDLSPEQEIEYFRRVVGQGPLADWWQAISTPTDVGIVPISGTGRKTKDH